MRFSNVLRVALPVAFAALVATGCGGDDGVLGLGGIPDGSICVVNGTGITKSEYDRNMRNAKQSYKDNGREFPKKKSDEYTTLQDQLVDYLIQQQLVRDQAKRFDLKASDKEIDAGVKELKQQVSQGDEKKFKSEMKRVGYTIDLVKQDVEFDVLSEKLYKHVVKNIQVSDADAKEYYDAHKDEFETKKSRDVAHILVKTKAEADAVYAQVNGKSEAVFTKVAKAKTTDDASKDAGGLMKGVQIGQTVPEFEKMTFALKTGQTSKPVKTTYGWHVLQARSDIKPASTQKFSEVKDQIKEQLNGQQEGDRYQEWIKDVRKDAEDSVACHKGYTWTQTVTTDTSKASATKQ